MRQFALLLLLAASCARPAAVLTESEKEAIRREVEGALRDAYDLRKPGVAERMLALYPASGRVISASGGRVVASRDTIAIGIRYFWTNVGSNMKDPKWIWESIHTDVLSPTAAVVTATYRIPHRTPANRPHELGGAMTEVFEKRNGRWVIVQEHLSDLPQLQDSSTTTATHEHH